MKPYIIYHESGAIESEQYWIDSKLHRLDGSAVTWYHESGAIKSEYYCVNDILHRLDGPAVINYHESGAIHSKQYFVDGNDITEQVIDWIGDGNDIDDTVLFKLTFG